MSSNNKITLKKYTFDKKNQPPDRVSFIKYIFNFFLTSFQLKVLHYKSFVKIWIVMYYKHN